MATSYSNPVVALCKLGKPSDDDWLDYAALGISAAQGAELIRLATDTALHRADVSRPEAWGPVHAWRALGQLKVGAAVGPLLELLRLPEDQWRSDAAMADLPEVFGLIGPDAIAGLTLFLQDESNDPLARDVAAAGLREVALSFGDFRGQCLAILTTALEKHHRNPVELNALLLEHLVALKATEAAGRIKEAFDCGDVDEQICGSWAQVQRQLGALFVPPARPAQPPARKPAAPKPPARPRQQLGTIRPIFSITDDEDGVLIGSAPLPVDLSDDEPIVQAGQSSTWSVGPAAPPITPDSSPAAPNSGPSRQRPAPVSSRPKLTPRERERLKDRRKNQRQARKSNRRR